MDTLDSIDIKTKNDEKEMNEDLIQWTKEHKLQLKEDDAENSCIHGKCERCELKDAKYKCIKCEKIFCMACFWKMIGMCKDCISEEQMKEYHF